MNRYLKLAFVLVALMAGFRLVGWAELDFDYGLGFEPANRRETLLYPFRPRYAEREQRSISRTCQLRDFNCTSLTTTTRCFRHLDDGGFDPNRDS